VLACDRRSVYGEFECGVRLSLAWRCAYDGAGAAGSDRDDLHVVHRAVPHRERKRPIVELRAAPLALRQSIHAALVDTHGTAKTAPHESSREHEARESPAAAPLGGSILGSAARGQPVDAAARAQGTGYSRGARVAQATGCPKEGCSSGEEEIHCRQLVACMHEWATLALRSTRSSTRQYSPVPDSTP
jgi:hypothetical protein